MFGKRGQPILLSRHHHFPFLIPTLPFFPLWNGLLLGDLSRYESHEEDLVTTKKQPKNKRYQLSRRKMVWNCETFHNGERKQNKPGTSLEKCISL